MARCVFACTTVTSQHSRKKEKNNTFKLKEHVWWQQIVTRVYHKFTF